MAAPEWGDFKIVLALGRGGSVAAAGRLLEIDSSTVSRKLTAIEEALGAILVIRSGREFCLTAEGKEAFAAAEAIEATIVRAAAAIHAVKTHLEGVVKISAFRRSQLCCCRFRTSSGPTIPSSRSNLSNQSSRGSRQG